MRETLEFIASTNFEGADDRAIAIIAQFLVYRAKDALAQPEQEPVGRVCFSGDEVVWTDDSPESGTLLYTSPPAPVQQEPVAWHTEDHLTDRSATTYSKEMVYRWECKGWPVTPLYTTPPQRKPLTDEEIQYALESEFLSSDEKRNWQDDLRVARAIEAAHGIKEKNT